MTIRILLPLLLLGAVPANAQSIPQPAAPSAANPTPAAGLTIGDQAFAPADFVDARAIPDREGPPVIMLTFSDAGMAKLAEATREGNSGATVMVPIAVDGQKISDLVTTEVRSDPVLTFTARGRTIDQATALARHISGRDPLPEDASSE